MSESNKPRSHNPYNPIETTEYTPKNKSFEVSSRSGINKLYLKKSGAGFFTSSLKKAGLLIPKITKGFKPINLKIIGGKNGVARNLARNFSRKNPVRIFLEFLIKSHQNLKIDSILQFDSGSLAIETLKLEFKSYQELLIKVLEKTEEFCPGFEKELKYELSGTVCGMLFAQYMTLPIHEIVIAALAVTTTPAGVFLGIGILVGLTAALFIYFSKVCIEKKYKMPVDDFKYVKNTLKKLRTEIDKTKKKLIKHKPNFKKFGDTAEKTLNTMRTEAIRCKEYMINKAVETGIDIKDDSREDIACELCDKIIAFKIKNEVKDAKEVENKIIQLESATKELNSKSLPEVLIAN